MSYIDYVHVCNKFLVSNSKNIFKVKETQDKKLCNLLLRNMGNNSDTCQDPDKVIFNFLGYNLSDHEFLVPFEMLFRDINSLEVSNLNKECVNTKPGVLYGLAKIHKALEDGTQYFPPILSAIGTPTYNLAKFCDQLLKPLTSNDYTIKDSFSFAKDVLDFDASCFMASFDIKSLFTNIPLTDTSNLCVQNFYRNQTHINNLTKSSFYKLLKITMFESLFIFDGKFYEQCHGVAMGSPLGPTLANVFMCHFENIWLENCPSHFKPIGYRRFVDDTFLLFRSKDHVEKFRNYLNKQHKNITFTSAIEENGLLSFLDIKISRENKFVTSVYRKPTFTGVFTNFQSFLPDIYNRGLIETLLHRSFRLCSNYENFHHEIETLKSILKHNSYPHNLVNHCIKTFLNKLFVQFLKGS